jgi:hypothetical protein
MNIADFVIGYEEFKVRYLEAGNNIKSATRFWNTYNHDPHSLLINRQYLLLRDRLFSLLTACKRIDADVFAKIHKGHPFYFIGISSYLLDDYQTAIYFLDAAVTEDINSGADPIDRPSPSTRFLMLEGEAEDQAAKEITQIAQAKVERALTHYNDKIAKNSNVSQLTLDDLRSDFICYALRATEEPGLRTLITAFITYCTEWDFRKDHYEYGVGKGTSEPFLLHLFRGCILLESLLRHNPTISPQKNMLGKMLKEPQIRDALKIKDVQGGKFDLNDLFEKLQTFDYSIYEAIQISYMARNTLGHSLGWNTYISQSQYQELYLIIASSCLHVLACLWISHPFQESKIPVSEETG